MKSKIGMVSAGLYFLAFLADLLVVSMCNGETCGYALIPFYLPWGMFMDRFVSSLFYMPGVDFEMVAIVLNVLINAAILYVVGLGLTKFRTKNLDNNKSKNLGIVFATIYFIPSALSFAYYIVFTGHRGLNALSALPAAPWLFLISIRDNNDVNLFILLASISLILNTSILYLIGLGITRLRGGDKIQAL